MKFYSDKGFSGILELEVLVILVGGGGGGGEEYNKFPPCKRRGGMRNLTLSFPVF